MFDMFQDWQHLIIEEKQHINSKKCWCHPYCIKFEEIGVFFHDYGIWDIPIGVIQEAVENLFVEKRSTE